MDNELRFIKIFNEQIAKMLASGGFSYITEKINDNQDVYIFEKNDGLTEKLKELDGTVMNFENTILVEDGTLHF